MSDIMKKVETIGIGSAFNSKLGNTSFGIPNGDAYYIIDCGSTVFKALKELGNLDSYESYVVALSHMHTDHIGSLGTLIEYLYYKRNIVANIVVPKELESSVITYLKLSGVDLGKYHIISNDENEVLLNRHDEMSTVSFIEVPHVNDIKSFAISVQMDKGKLLYSGDTQTYEPLLEHIRQTGIEYDNVIVDFSLEGSEVHQSKLSELIELKETLDSQIILTHLDTDEEEYFRFAKKLRQI